MKKFINYVLMSTFIVTILFNCIGCNKLTNTAETDSNTSEEGVTIKLSWWGNDKRGELTKKAIELFQQKYPSIKFEIKNYSSTVDEKIGLAMDTAGEDMPDIIQMDYSFFYNYAQRNLLEPLDMYVGDKILNVSDIDKSYIEGGIYNSKLYGISLGTNAYCMAVNPEVFRKVGIDIPKSGYTYDELYSVAKTLKEKINDPDFYPLASFVDFNTFIRSRGNTYYDSTGTKLGYEDDKVFVDYIKILKKYKDEGLILPDSVIDKNSMITSGKSAFLFGVTNNVSGLSKGANNIMQIISVPSFTTGKITSYTRQSMFFGVSAYSKHKKEAIEFIDFITNDQEVNNILKGERGVPVSEKIRESVKQKLSEADIQQYTFMDYLKEHSSPSDPPIPNSAGNVTSLFTRLSGQALNDEITPEDAAKQFRVGANKILSGVKGE